MTNLKDLQKLKMKHTPIYLDKTCEGGIRVQLLSESVDRVIVVVDIGRVDYKKVRLQGSLSVTKHNRKPAQFPPAHRQ